MTFISWLIIHLVPVAQAAADTTTKDAATSSDQIDIVSYIIQKLPFWIIAIVVLIISLLIALVVKNSVESRLAKKIEGESHQEILLISGRLSFVLVAVIGITIALAIAGINLTTLLAAIGFGISFGLQDTVANFVAGIGILASRPFSIGDWIQTKGPIGKVMEIKTRFTVLKTYNGICMIVPNSELYKGNLTNYTRNATRRLKIPAYCRYGVNMKEVYTLILNLVQQSKDIFPKPAPSIIISDLADSYIALQVRIWVDSRGQWRKIGSRTAMKIQECLEKAGLDAPYPITSLSMEPDIEGAVLKTYAMDDKSLAEQLNDRANEEAEFVKKKKKLLGKKEVTQQELPADQTGTEFLRNDLPLQPIQQIQNSEQAPVQPESQNTEQVPIQLNQPSPISTDLLSQAQPTLAISQTVQNMSVTEPTATPQTQPINQMPEWLKNAAQGLSNSPAQNQPIALPASFDQSQMIPAQTQPSSQISTEAIVQTVPVSAPLTSIPAESANAQPTQPSSQTFTVAVPQPIPAPAAFSPASSEPTNVQSNTANQQTS